MEFNYVVGRKNIDKNKETVLAGFTSLEAAKKQARRVEADFLSNGYFYVDSPDGRYICGCSRINHSPKNARWLVTRQPTLASTSKIS